jgi:hypothetical protein
VVHALPLGLFPFFHGFDGEMGKVGIGIVTRADDLVISTLSYALLLLMIVGSLSSILKAITHLVDV